MNVDMEKFIVGLHEHLGKTLRPLAERIKRLEELTRQIEARGILFKGVFQRCNEYEFGDLVTYKGAMWHAVADRTRQVPGEGPDWQLAVQAGRDGRDAR